MLKLHVQFMVNLAMLKGIFYGKKMQMFAVYLSFSNDSFFLFLLSANRAAHAQNR